MDYKHTCDTIFTRFQGITNHIYGFGKPFFAPSFFYPSTHIFPRPYSFLPVQQLPTLRHCFDLNLVPAGHIGVAVVGFAIICCFIIGNNFAVELNMTRVLHPPGVTAADYDSINPHTTPAHL